MQLGEWGVAYDTKDGTPFNYCYTRTRVGDEWVKEIRIDVSALDLMFRTNEYNARAYVTYKAQAEDYTVKTADHHLAIVADSIHA